MMLFQIQVKGWGLSVCCRGAREPGFRDVSRGGSYSQHHDGLRPISEAGLTPTALEDPTPWTCGLPSTKPCCLPVSSAAASHRPTPCPAGTFSSLPEQTMPSACQVCPRSFYCKEAGLQAPSGQCPAGERQQDFEVQAKGQGQE